MPTTARRTESWQRQTAAADCLPPAVARFFDRNPRYERNGGPWISLVQEYFIFRNSRPPPVPTTALQFSPRVDACWDT